MSSPPIPIILVAFNNRDALIPLVEEIRASCRTNYYLYIVDNGSTDHVLLDFLQCIQEQGEGRVVFFKQNLLLSPALSTALHLVLEEKEVLGDILHFEELC